MYNHGRKLNGFVLNKRIEKIVDSSITKIKTIPLEHIRRYETILDGWQLQSQTAPSCWYAIVEPYTSYILCSCEWCIRGNMYKHQLIVIKASANISWGVILEFFGTCYESLRGGIGIMFELNIPIGSFENGHVRDSEDNIDNNNDVIEVKKNDIEDITNIDGDIHCTCIELLKQIQSSIKGCLLAIQKLQKDAREEAKESGLLLVQHLQAMMIKTLTDLKQIRGQIEADNLHP